MTVNEWQRLFSNRIESLMRDNNMSQYRLAKTTGIPPSRLNEYIKMKTMPSIFAVINLAYIFDVSVESLIDFDERIEQRRM